MKEKVLLWDIGNVVVQWSPDAILERLAFSPKQSLYLRNSLFGHSDWLDLDRGITTEDVVARRLMAESGLSIEEAQRCFSVVRETLVDIDRSVALIYELAQKNVPMYVLSNMSKANADYLRKRQYFDCFRGVVFSAEEKLNKPTAELFTRVLDRYSLTADGVLFIDDTLENIEAAKDLGFEVLLFKGEDNCYQQILRFVDL